MKKPLFCFVYYKCSWDWG